MICLCWTNLFVSIYQGTFKPFDNRKQNQIQIINEYLISSIAYNAILFTDVIVDQKQKYFYGWAMILVVSLTFIINTCLICWVSARQVKLLCIKLYNHCSNAWIKAKTALKLIFNKKKTNKTPVSPET